MIFAILITLYASFVWITSGTQLLESFQLREGPTAHGLQSGPLEIIDTRTIRIPNLHYDGAAPDAFWIVGVGSLPPERPNTAPGNKIPGHDGTCQVLKAFNGETITLVLPEAMTVNDFDWLGMYCFKYKHTFGWVDFASVRKNSGNGQFQNVPEASETLVTPQSCGQQTIIQLGQFKLRSGESSPLPHNLRSGPIQIVNLKTLRIQNLHYDGKGPDAYWMVGRGDPPREYPGSTPGEKIPDETGDCGVLKAYAGKTIELVLPGGPFTVDNIDWLAIHCIKFKHTFGWVDIKKVRDGLPSSTFGKSFLSYVTPPRPCRGSISEAVPIMSAAAVLLNLLAGPFRANP